MRDESFCFGHHPAYEEDRKEYGRKGAQIGGRGRGVKSEMRAVKTEIRNIIDGVLDGSIERSAGAVAFQGYNQLLKAYETERRLLETVELEQRITELEEAAKKRGGSHWGYTTG